MKIVGGRGRGSDRDKSRIVNIESGDTAFEVQAYAMEDGGITLRITPIVTEEMTPLDDPVETAEPKPPFWVRPVETWELLAQDLIRDARAGMVDIVAESCLQGMVISGWQGEAWGRLHVSLAKAMKEVCYD